MELVAGDPPQPCPEIVPPPERRQLPVRREEHLLRDILNVIGVVHLAGDIATQRETERSDDDPEPVPIATAHLVQHNVDLSMREHGPSFRRHCLGLVVIIRQTAFESHTSREEARRFSGCQSVRKAAATHNNHPLLVGAIS
jgi:hypothetical protein